MVEDMLAQTCVEGVVLNVKRSSRLEVGLALVVGTTAVGKFEAADGIGVAVERGKAEGACKVGGAELSKGCDMMV